MQSSSEGETEYVDHHVHHSSLPMGHSQLWMGRSEIMLTDEQIVKVVQQDGRLNALGSRIVIKSNWNLRLPEDLCKSMSDREVLTFLKYGWPINHDNSPLPRTYMNHDSANKHPNQVH